MEGLPQLGTYSSTLTPLIPSSYSLTDCWPTVLFQVQFQTTSSSRDLSAGRNGGSLELPSQVNITLKSCNVYVPKCRITRQEIMHILVRTSQFTEDDNRGLVSMKKESKSNKYQRPSLLRTHVMPPRILQSLHATNQTCDHDDYTSWWLTICGKIKFISYIMRWYTNL